MAYAAESCAAESCAADTNAATPPRPQLTDSMPEWMLTSGYEAVPAPMVMATYGPATYEAARPVETKSRTGPPVGVVIGTIALVGYTVLVLLMVNSYRE